MRKQKGLIAAIVALSIVVSSAVMPFGAKAATNYASVEETVNVALAEKNFYYFNLAFERIMQLTDEQERYTLLAKLDTITSIVWTKDISETVANFVVIVNDKSGKVYDETQAKINTSSLKEIDKRYLLNELNTWGKDTVWTTDYIKAVDAIIKVWYDKTKDDYNAAVAAIATLNLEVNQSYLTGLLDEAKIAVGLAETLAGDTTVPAGDTTAPAGDTTVPAGDTTAPADNATVPAGDTTAPTDNTTVPADNTTAPVDETTTVNP